MGGSNSSGTKQDIIDYITMASTGNATDFGNLTEAVKTGSAISSNHGGLQ